MNYRTDDITPDALLAQVADQAGAEELQNLTREGLHTDGSPAAHALYEAAQTLSFALDNARHAASRLARDLQRIADGEPATPRTLIGDSDTARYEQAIGKIEVAREALSKALWVYRATLPASLEA